MKKVSVVWSAEAFTDLETIYDFLAEQAPESAQKIAEKILSRTRQIETFPESGTEQIFQAKKYRYLVEGNYKIIYRIEDRCAYILTVFDTRYNPDKLKLQ